MELKLLAKKQKRLLFWTEFVESEVHDEQVRHETLATLKEYRELLARCWEAEAVSEDSQAQLEDLERKLEALNELARTTVTPGQ